MEYIDLRKRNRDELKQIRSQVVRLKKMGKTGKEIEELTGVRPNRISEIWTAYQREGESSFITKKHGSKPGERLLLKPEDQESIRRAIVEHRPDEYGMAGALWTLKKVRELVWKKCHKKITTQGLSNYMRRWGLSCQRPVKRALKQDPLSV